MQLRCEKHLKAAFKAFDIDGNGNICYLVFEEIFETAIDKAELQQIFEEIDVTKNNVINFEEFKFLLKKMFSQKQA